MSITIENDIFPDQRLKNFLFFLSRFKIENFVLSEFDDENKGVILMNKQIVFEI